MSEAGNLKICCSNRLAISTIAKVAKTSIVNQSSEITVLWHPCANSNAESSIHLSAVSTENTSQTFRNVSRWNDRTATMVVSPSICQYPGRPACFQALTSSDIGRSCAVAVEILYSLSFRANRVCQSWSTTTISRNSVQLRQLHTLPPPHTACSPNTSSAEPSLHSRLEPSHLSDLQQLCPFLVNPPSIPRAPYHQP